MIDEKRTHFTTLGSEGEVGLGEALGKEGIAVLMDRGIGKALRALEGV